MYALPEATPFYDFLKDDFFNEAVMDLAMLFYPYFQHYQSNIISR
jgi:hypothetical protein